MKNGASPTKHLPATLLLTYQAEYENTPDLTIDDLCQKYNVTTKQLKGYTKWVKRPPAVTEPNIVNSQLIETLPKVPIKTKEDKEIDILDNIEEFKQLAIAHAVKFIKEDARFAEVKEFKDMVAIVDSIEKSYKNTTAQTPTINILVQNLAKKFSEEDV